MVVFHILQNPSGSRNSVSGAEGTMMPDRFVTGADFHCILMQRPEWG